MSLKRRIIINSFLFGGDSLTEYIRGVKNGIPIGLGYVSVAFTFGIMAIMYGLSWWQAGLVSMLTLTSAGQFAGIGIMAIPNGYIAMLVSQLTINVRYAFMSISLSQKTDTKFKGLFKWLLGFFITDEIFAVAINEDNIKRSYFLGVATLPYFGWAVGTICGAIVGNILPLIVLNSLGIAIYGMFIAIIMPKVKVSKKVLLVVVIAIIFSILFYYLPYLKDISSGIAISICAVLSALIGALFFPEKEEK